MSFTSANEKEVLNYIEFLADRHPQRLQSLMDGAPDVKEVIAEILTKAEAKRLELFQEISQQLSASSSEDDVWDNLPLLSEADYLSRELINEELYY